MLPGSSPHTRGARRRRARTPPPGGDHPRIRGEHPAGRRAARDADGIDPRIRGEHWFSRVQRVLSSGIIPAYAGSTPSHIPPSVSAQDHPRIRGEHGLSVQSLTPCAGIIPAYAGSTLHLRYLHEPSAGSSPHTRGARSTRGWTAGTSWDHPRIRGEHLRWRRMRSLGTRIIPAYAGSTYRCQTDIGKSLDDPRIRGEHYRQDEEPDYRPGIIPAYAGSTRTGGVVLILAPGSSPHTRGAPAAPSRPSSSPRDHPRIRGEHFKRNRRRAKGDGIIPAYAGSTGMVPVESVEPEG